MKAPLLAKNYSCLTPEERFRLILAASGRGDDAERARLRNAGERITLSVRDHAPYAQAFDELALHVFIQLLDEAARYHDDFDRLDDAELGNDDEVEEEPEDESNAKSDEEPAEPADRGRIIWERYFDLALASGYELRTTAEGWKLFCQRLNVPPFLHWENLPGFDRLQRALALAEKAAAQLDTVGRGDQPEPASAPSHAGGAADWRCPLCRPGPLRRLAGPDPTCGQD